MESARLDLRRVFRPRMRASAVNVRWRNSNTGERAPPPRELSAADRLSLPRVVAVAVSLFPPVRARLCQRSAAVAVPFVRSSVYRPPFFVARETLFVRRFSTIAFQTVIIYSRARKCRFSNSFFYSLLTI